MTTELQLHHMQKHAKIHEVHDFLTKLLGGLNAAEERIFQGALDSGDERISPVAAVIWTALRGS